jgi:hypothetical protein
MKKIVGMSWILNQTCWIFLDRIEKTIEIEDFKGIVAEFRGFSDYSKLNRKQI